jgi:hypothetical protein
MRPLALLPLLLAIACQERRASPEPVPTRPAASAASAGSVASVSSPDRPEARPAWTAGQEACVDRWLAGHRLDAYGAPQGTMYAGGTPLFDEASGRTTPRRAYLESHRPEALRACPSTD